MTLTESLLRWFYSRLTREDRPGPADLIFVLAGKMERKQFGLELYREGLADRLILSVGRFEVSKMAALDVAGVAELISYRDRIPPEQRHFFCEIEAHRMRIANPRLLKWNTYGEVLALREYLAGGRPDELDLAGGRALTRMIIVSTDIHLRRVALVAERLFRGWPLRFQCCPVPRGRSPVWEEKWWTRRADRRYVISETLKLAAYRAILLMPESIIRGSLRLCRPRQNPGL